MSGFVLSPHDANTELRHRPDAEEPLDIKDIPGGKYANLRIHGLAEIGEAWHHLARWCQENGYDIASDREPCLEELHTPIDRPIEDWEMDLYLAVDGT